MKAEAGEDFLVLSGGEVHSVERSAITRVHVHQRCRLIGGDAEPAWKASRDVKVAQCCGAFGREVPGPDMAGGGRDKTRSVGRECQPEWLARHAGKTLRLGERAGVEDANEVVVATHCEHAAVGAELRERGCRHLELGSHHTTG